MNDAQLLERERRSQMAGYRAIARAVPSSRGVDVAPGLFASVVPATPHASIPNSVLYTDPAAVIEHHEALAALYAQAGVHAWTVWVRPGDDELERTLGERGHALDGSPAVMAAELAGLDLAPRTELELAERADWTALAALNDRAFGRPVGAMGAALGRAPGWEQVLAVLDGRPACGLGFMVTAEGDCTVNFVATAPEAQGRGLASEVMCQALRRARDAGALTTSLEASAMGEPMYARLGYRTLGRLRMLERRVDA